MPTPRGAGAAATYDGKIFALDFIPLLIPKKRGKQFAKERSRA
jgi:hypothetical protein